MTDDRAELKRAHPLYHQNIEKFFHDMRVDPKTRQIRWPPLVGAPSAMIEDNDDEDDELSAPLPDDGGPTKRRRALKRARIALVEAAFDAATTPAVRRRILRARGLAIVVSVPSSTWVAPIARYLGELIEGEQLERDGLQRPKDDGNELTSRALAAGRNVIGVSHSPHRLLPSLLVASTDIRIDIASPDPATIARALRLSLRGRMPRDLPSDLGAGLDFSELASAIRKGTTPAEAIARMQAIILSRNMAGPNQALPRLQDALFYGEARRWGLELANDVASVRRGETDFSQIARSAVFFGPPGTGKTVLARMIAMAAGLPIIESSVAELFAASSGYLDGVIKAQRTVFARAAAAAPCVLFVDEIDALPNRANMSPRNKDFWMPVVDDFLLLVASAPPGIIMLAATNRIQDVDEALLRPGRFERQIKVDAANTAEGLAGILRFHLGQNLAGVDLVRIARFGLGATAAQAMEWVRAARRTARVAKRPISTEDLLAEIAPPDDRSEEVLTRSAVHEAAHAILGLVLGVESINQISIIKRGLSGGHVTFSGSRSVQLGQRDWLEKKVMFILAGRAAEVVFFGNPSAGAGGYDNSDLALATRVVAAMHFSLGLTGSLVYRGDPQDQEEVLRFDPILRDAVDADLRSLSAKAEELVRQYRPAIQAVTDAVLAQLVITGTEIKALLESAGINCAGTPIAPSIEGLKSTSK